MKLTILTAWLICCGTLSSFAQSFSISGIVMNISGEPLNAGEVIITDPVSQATIAKADLLNGLFLIKDIQPGEYMLRINAMGYKLHEERITLSQNLELSFSLEPEAYTLKEVTVSASKPPISFKNGNIIVNVDNPAFSSVPDALMLLSKIPTLQLGADGESLSVAGKGEPIIYINNQRASINDVKSLAVADISTFELITNPSARYEADGRVVLLIRTRFNSREGVRGELNQAAAIRKYYLNRASANASYRKKKLELKSSIQINHLKTWEGNASTFRMPARNIFSGYSVTAVTSRLPLTIGSAGLFYQINELDYISFNGSGRMVTERFPIYTDSWLDEQGNHETVSTSNFSTSKERYYNSNINFNKGFRKSNANLFAGFQYTHLGEDTRSNVFNKYNDSELLPAQDRHLNSGITVYAGRVDFEKKFKSGAKFEAGATLSRAVSSGGAIIYTYEPQQSLNSTYDYKEGNMAIYSQLAGKFKKLEWSAGIRMETTNVDGNYKQDGIFNRIDRSSTNLFPRISFTYSPDSVKSIGLRYSKSINRPNYSNANQSVVYINPYFEWANNINLNPSLFQEIVATFQYRKYKLEASVFSHAGAVNTNIFYDAQRGVLQRSELNFKRESGIFIGNTFIFKKGRWSSTNVVNFIYNTIEDPAGQKLKTTPFVFATSTNEFALPHQFTLTASGWGVTKSYQGVFERNSYYAVDTSLSKKLGKFTCTLRFDDIFNSINFREQFTINDIGVASRFFDARREYSLGVKYNFGRLKESAFKNRDVDEQGGRVR